MRDKQRVQAQGFDVDNMTFENRYSLVVKDNITYLILDIGDYQYVNSDVSLLVYAYDSNNKLVGAKSVN